MPAPKGNKYALGNKGGRPSKYDPAFVDKLFDYLDWCEKNPIILGKTKTDSVNVAGELIAREMTEEQQTVPRVPSLAGFSVRERVPVATLQSWGDAHEEFSVALKHLARVQENILIELGSSGLGNSRFNQFMLSAKHEYREKTETQVDGELSIHLVAFGGHDPKPDAV